MASLLARLEEQRTELLAELDEIETKAEEAGSYEGLRERADEITRTTLPALNEDIMRAKVARERERNAPAAVVEDDQPTTAGPITPVGSFAAMPASPSAQFLASEEWREYMTRVAPTGNVSHKTRVESPKISIEGGTLPWLRQHAEVVTGGSATSAGALILPGQTGIFDVVSQRLRVVDLLTRGSTDSDTVEYVRETAFTNKAGSVPEATHIAAADETPANASHKPWSELALARVSEPVKTIAHGVPATTRALADAGQMRTYIEGRLRYGLALELERQVLAGAGTGEDFEGILENSDIQAQAFATDIAVTLRKAITKVELADSEPNGIVLHPEDWEELDLLLTFAGGGTNNRQAAEMSRPILWGLAVVSTRSITKGTALVGDFRQAFLWDRQQTTIDASSGYMDFFMRNLVAIRAEMRAAFGVIRPEAFVEVTFGS